MTPKIIRAYRAGKAVQGWSCGKCEIEFPHDGKRLRTFAALTRHAVAKHHRLPRPMGTSTTWTSTHTVWHVWGGEQS